MTEDQIELNILRRYTDQHKDAELHASGSKCARELDIRNVLAEITGQSGNELEYTARLWLDRLAPRASDSKGPLRRCSDSRVNEGEHRWHARAHTDSGSGSASAWDRIRELEARLSQSVEQKQSLWKCVGRWLFTTTGKIVIGVIIAVSGAWAVYKWGPHGRAISITKQTASIEFEQARPFVSPEVYGPDQINVYYFKMRIYNPRHSTIRAKYLELADLRTLEGGEFIPWQNADPVVLMWDARTGKEIPPQAKVLVSFARIFPPELQKKTDRILSGDLDIPQLRFTVDGWPRKMRSHVPPGTHRFKLTVYFEEGPAAEAEFELQWSGNHRESVQSMAQEIAIRKIGGSQNSPA